MLEYFKAVLSLPELFVELMDTFDMTNEAEEALYALLALSKTGYTDEEKERLGK